MCVDCVWWVYEGCSDISGKLKSMLISIARYGWRERLNQCYSCIFKLAAPVHIICASRTESNKFAFEFAFYKHDFITY